MIKRGFTLLEVLIAGGVLFIVSSAVVGLSNSIVQGTSTTSDQAQITLWSQQGLEYVNKIRDDSVSNLGNIDASTGTQQEVWFNPASDPSQYGWYVLGRDANGDPTLSRAGFDTSGNLAIKLSDFPSNGELLTSQALTAYRLICIESYGAVDTPTTPGSVNCNSDTNGNQVNDGQRSVIYGGCQYDATTHNPDDLFCAATQPSLNVNTGGSTMIPSGNAIKVRSVVVWQNRQTYQDVNVSTLLTNWQNSLAITSN